MIRTVDPEGANLERSARDPAVGSRKDLVMLSRQVLEATARNALGVQAVGILGDAEKGAIARAIAATIQQNNVEIRRELDSIWAILAKR
jgi:hypothetical protein